MTQQEETPIWVGMISMGTLIYIDIITLPFGIDTLYVFGTLAM